ncbi:MAG: hypothetical protein Fur007_13870 [Rhodoferax sp.]
MDKALEAKNPLMVVDVESVGLHGEGFAVAWAVWAAGAPAGAAPLAQGLWACPPRAARGTAADMAWVLAHVPPLPAACATPADVRARFWADWLLWREKGAYMLVDCGWPVEAQFLSACVAEAGSDAAALGPYPLLDLATLRALHASPLATLAQRPPDEMPAHDLRADVRQTHRLWQALMLYKK